MDFNISDGKILRETGWGASRHRLESTNSQGSSALLGSTMGGEEHRADVSLQIHDKSLPRSGTRHEGWQTRQHKTRIPVNVLFCMERHTSASYIFAFATCHASSHLPGVLLKGSTDHKASKWQASCLSAACNAGQPVSQCTW